MRTIKTVVLLAASLSLYGQCVIVFNPLTNQFDCDNGGGGGGSGTVTTVSTTTSLFTIANPTTTPSIDVSGNSGGIPYFNSATTLASSAALTAGALVVGGGAGAAPTVLLNSSVPNAGDLQLSTAPATGSTTRSVVTLGSAIASGSANGTIIGANYTSFTGDFFNLQTGGVNRFRVNNSGQITIGASSTFSTSGVSVTSSGVVDFLNSNAGASAAARLTGSAGTGSGNFLAIRGTSGGTASDQIRINGDSKAVMIGQTVDTNSVSNLSLGVFDDTATSGVTRLLVQAGAGQSATSLVEARLHNAALGSGALVFEVEADGSFRSIPTASKPSCASGIRGTYWYTQGGTGVKDDVEVCAKDAADAYAWRTIY